MEYQSDYILRIIEQMGAAIRAAFRRYREGGSAGESIDMVHEAIGQIVDMDPAVFLRLAPQSMVSFLELSNLDRRVTCKLAEAFLLEADLLESDGAIAEGAVRRAQASAVLASADPASAN